MGFHADGDAEPFGERHGGLEHPRGVSELLPAGPAVRGQRAPEHAYQRGLPVAGQLEEPAQFGTWIVTGETDRAVDRDDGQAGEGPLDPGTVGGGHRRVDELAVDEPEFDAGVAPPA